mmetsp:Transcript_56190/g.137781  ORF Transcript_56190/g.137781 Transcript_56190/m.137781 type:complete len:224 (+) Transcript_56190:276-947(+)
MLHLSVVRGARDGVHEQGLHVGGDVQGHHLGRTGCQSGRGRHHDPGRQYEPRAQRLHQPGQRGQHREHAHQFRVGRGGVGGERSGAARHAGGRRNGHTRLCPGPDSHHALHRWRLWGALAVGRAQQREPSGASEVEPAWDGAEDKGGVAQEERGGAAGRAWSGRAGADDAAWFWRRAARRGGRRRRRHDGVCISRVVLEARGTAVAHQEQAREAEGSNHRCSD